MLARSHNTAVVVLAALAWSCTPPADKPVSPPRDAPSGAPSSVPADVPWASHPLMGRCFPDARAFLAAAFGPHGRHHQIRQVLSYIPSLDI